MLLTLPPIPRAPFLMRNLWVERTKQLCTPLGNNSFMITGRLDSGLSNALPPWKTSFSPKSFSLTEAQLLSQDLRMAIAFLSLNMWDSTFLASMIAGGTFTSPPFSWPHWSQW